MANEMVKYDDFNYHGDRLPLAVIGGDPAVYFPRTAQLLGRDPDAEWRRLGRVEAYRSRMTETTDPITGARLLWLSRGALLHWLSSIYTDELPVQYRARHTAWVNGLIEAIDAYVTRGVAVNEDVVGPDARRRIEAIAEQARASRLAECRQFYEIARRDMPGDAILKARAEQMVRQIISREAGASGDRGPGTPDTIAGILGSVGCFWPDKAVNSFGTPVANEYRRRYGKDPERTNQYGRDSEPGTNSGCSVFPRCYPRVDWPWILDMARRYARDRKLPVPT